MSLKGSFDTRCCPVFTSPYVRLRWSSRQFDVDGCVFWVVVSRATCNRLWQCWWTKITFLPHIYTLINLLCSIVSTSSTRKPIFNRSDLVRLEYPYGIIQRYIIPHKLKPTSAHLINFLVGWNPLNPIVFNRRSNLSSNLLLLLFHGPVTAPEILGTSKFSSEQKAKEFETTYN